MRRTPPRVRTSRKSLKILHVYFWLHGLGLPSEFGPRCCNRRSALFASGLLAAFIEGNMLYVTHLVFRIYEPYGNDDIVRVSGLFAFDVLTLIQRYFLCSRNADLDQLLSRVLGVCSRMPTGSQPPDFRRALLVFLFAGDVLLALIITLFLGTLNNNPLYGLITKTTPSVSWVNVAYFCIFWKNTGHCVALYFAFVCFSLKWAFSGLGDVRQVGAYNELVDVAKSANEALHPVIFATLMECLGHVFTQTFNLFYARSESSLHQAYKVLYAIFNYMRFLLVCVSASSAASAAYDANYRIRGFPIVKRIPELSKHRPIFTLLDSIVVDRSLVLSASGILLTYGVMVATLSESSKNP